MITPVQESEGYGGFSTLFDVFFVQVSKSMSGVVKSMDATLKSMNLEKVKR